ncbi:MAG TPA: hypothetical protein VER83_09190 [Candidatus Nanopelagicales bacterium]|nr:hypothetical protein [Candidatus Nanopelagicales bacterium]
MRGQERQRHRLEEPAHGIAEVELDGQLVERGGLHLGPRGGERTRVGRVVEHAHRVDDVAARDRDPIVPPRVGAEMERPAGALLGHRPALGEIREDGAPGAEPDEAPEQERHQVAVRLRPGRERGDGGGAAEDALHVAE